MIKLITIGIIIGSGMILPGVSGGILAVILGVYEDLLKALNSFFKNIRKNTKFLAPITFGILIGAMVFGKILKFFFNNYPVEACYTFIGLIIGGFPTLFNKIKETKERKINLLFYFTALIISSSLFILSKNTINLEIKINSNLSTIYLFITGFIYIAGKIIPGISSSFLLMLINMYGFLLDVLSNPFFFLKNKLGELIPFILGILIGAIIWVKIVNFILKKYINKFYSSILGFVTGSLIAIYPGFSFNYHSFINLFLLATGLLCSLLFSKMEFNK